LRLNPLTREADLNILCFLSCISRY